MLKVKKIPVGMVQANCYIIYNNKEALIIDPGAQNQVISHFIEQLNVKPIAILLTHTHYDHIGALEKIRDTYQIPVYVSAKEQEWLGDPTKNLSSLTGHAITTQPADFTIEPTEKITLSDFEFTIVPTPGHSPGGLSIIFESDGIIMTGDALFAGSIGRTDLPGSVHKDLIVGIREQLFTLPEHYKIYPGHGEPSTIGHEIKTNPFLK